MSGLRSLLIVGGKSMDVRLSGRKSFFPTMNFFQQHFCTLCYAYNRVMLSLLNGCLLLNGTLGVVVNFSHHLASFFFFLSKNWLFSKAVFIIVCSEDSSRESPMSNQAVKATLSHVTFSEGKK